jgi:hypothetical protein
MKTKTNKKSAKESKSDQYGGTVKKKGGSVSKKIKK